MELDLLYLLVQVLQDLLFQQVLLCQLVVLVVVLLFQLEVGLLVLEQEVAVVQELGLEQEQELLQLVLV